MNTSRKTFLSVSPEFGHDSAVVDCIGCGVIPGKVAKNRTLKDQYLFSVSSDGHIQCWDSYQNECVFEYFTSTAISGGINDPVQCLSASFEDDGAGRLYTGTKGGLIRCFDLLTGSICTTFRNSNSLGKRGHDRKVDNVNNMIIFEELLISSSRETISRQREPTIRVWQREFGDCARILRSHTDTVTSTKVLNSWGPSRTILLSSSLDKTIRLWDTRLPDPCIQIMEGHRSPVGEVVHDNGVIYSTGISHYNYNSLEYDNDNDITLDKLGNNGKYKHDLLRSAHVQSKSTKNLKPILGQKLAKTVSHRLRRASLNIAVKLHAIPNRKKRESFHPFTNAITNFTSSHTSGHRSNLDIMVVHDLRMGLKIRELNYVDINNSKTNEDLHDHIEDIQLSKIMYSPDHGIRSLIISGSNSKKYGSVHRTVAVSMDTGEVLHMLKPGNSGVPTSISTSTSKHTDMISIGYNDGGLDFWKYTLETESSSSTKASPISSIEGNNNKDVVEDSSQETKIVEKKVGASFEKRMLNLAKASQENIASDEMKSFIQNLDSMKETCHNTINQLKDPNTPFIGKRILQRSLRQFPIDTFEMLKQMKRKRIWPTADIITIAIQISLLCNDTEMALQIFSSCRLHGEKPPIQSALDMFEYLAEKNENTFKIELKEKNPCVQFARKVIVQMKRSGVIPNEIVYDSLSSMFSRIGEITLAYQSLQEMQRLGIPCRAGAYRSLLLAKYHTNDIDGMYFIKKEMLKARLKFIIKDHTLMVNALCKNDKINEAIKEIEEMKSKEIGFFGRKEANETFCETMLKKMIKEKENLESEQIYLDKIENVLGNENIGLKRFLLSGYLYTKQWKNALELVKHMEKEYLNATKRTSNDIHAVANDIPSILDVNTFLVYFGDKGKNSPDEAFKFSARMHRVFDVKPNPRSQSILLNACVKANKIDLAVEHFESIKRSGVSVDVSVYNALIDAHCKRFNMVEAVSIVKYMEEVGTSTNFKTFEILLEGAYASKSVEVAQTFVLEKIKEDANSVSSKTIGFAILTFASVASVDSFVELNNLLIENNVEHDQYSLSSIVYGCVLLDKFIYTNEDHKNGDDDNDDLIILDDNKLKAVEFLDPLNVANETLKKTNWEEISSNSHNDRRKSFRKHFPKKQNSTSSIPSLSESCSKLVTAFCRGLHIDEALNIVEIMKTFGITLLGECHGSLISAYVRIGNTDRANEMVQELVEAALIPKNAPAGKNLKVNLGSSTMDIDNIKTRLRLAAKGHNKGKSVAAKKETVNVKAMTDLIKTLCRAYPPQLKSARRVLYICLKSNLLPPQDCFHELISASGRAKRPRFSQEIFDKMVRLGMPVTRESWVALTNAYKDSGDAEKTCQLLIEMKRQGIRPGDELYTLVLHACIEVNYLPGCKKIIHEMERRNIKISIDLYNNVIKSYCTPKSASSNTIDKIDASNASKSSKIFSVDIDGAMYIFGSMKKNGIRPNLKTFTNLFYGAGRAKHLKLLETMHKELKSPENGLQMDVFTYEAYLFGLVRCQELAKAKRVVEKMKETKDANLKPGASTLSLLLEGAARVVDIKTTRSILEELSSKGMIPTDKGYISAAYVFATNRDTEEAFALLETWKLKRKRKRNYTKYQNSADFGKLKQQKYGWPGLTVSKALLDSLAYEIDHLRTPLDLSEVLEKATAVLEMSYNNEGMKCVQNIRAHLRNNRLLLKLNSSKKSIDFLWKKPQIEMFENIENFVSFIDEEEKK